MVRTATDKLDCDNAPFEHALLQALLKGADTQRLLDVAEPYLGNPLLVGNLSLDVLGSTSLVDVEDEAWNSVCSPGLESHFASEEQIRRLGVEPGEHATTVKLDGYSFRSMVCTANWRGKPLAYVVAYEYSHKFRAADEWRLELLAQAVGSNIVAATGERSLVASKPEQLLLSLLEGTASDLAVASDSLERMLGSKRWLIAMAEPAHRQLPSDDTGAGRASSEIPFHLVSAVRYDLPRALAVPFGGGVAIMLGIGRNSPEAMPMALEAGDRNLLSLLDASMQRRGMRCGLSGPFDNPELVASSYEHAFRALDLGRRFGFSTDVRCDYADVALYDMFDTVCQAAPSSFAASMQTGGALSQYLDPSVTGLLSFDSSHGTRWFVTFATYILLGRSRTLTAKELSIHRSTLQYRLDRIEDAMQVDIDNPAFANRVYLTLLALRYQNPAEFDRKYGIDPRILCRGRSHTDNAAGA